MPNGIGNGYLVDKAKVVSWVINFLMVIVVSFVGYTASGIDKKLDTLNQTITRIDKEVTEIKANRFTAADGTEVWKELAKKPNREEVPPPVVKEWMAQTNSRINRLEEVLHKHDK